MESFASRISQLLDWFAVRLGQGSPKATSSTAMAAPTETITLGGSSLPVTWQTVHSNPASILAMFAHKDFIFLGAQLALSAMAIIWLGAHGALRRPPSAAERKGKSGKEDKKDRFTEGLVASDAIMLPLMAGAVLVGLYYLIKWLDPVIINRILRAYFSLIAVASMGKLFADALHVLTSLAFPNTWRDGSGRVFEIDPVHRCQWLLEKSSETELIRVSSPERTNPFPGLLSRFPLSQRLSTAAWELRHLLTERWSFHLAMRGLCNIKSSFKLNDLLGLPLALLATSLYYVMDVPAISNLIGLALCYTAFIVMSPTSFGIGSLVLWGLFVYDIVMVFYTPYMITVATKLDVPIKLTFNGPTRSSMLGLGDIVIPGIFIALALRFDLWLHYHKQIQYVPVELETEMQSGASGKSTKETTTKHKQVKIPYVDVQGRWGDRWWTTGWRALFSKPTPVPGLAATTFPKTYFCASMSGYALGIFATLTMLLVFDHGQPALLYLVPGVTGAAWLTGLVRGEISEMWAYTEDGTLDTEDVVVVVDGNGQVVQEISKKDGPSQQQSEKRKAQEQAPNEEEDKTRADLPQKPNEGDKGGSANTANSPKQDPPKHTCYVFLLSISAPPPLK